MGNTIRLRSGAYLDLANPQPDQFELSDIAGALSKICRFGGQCDVFYSVAMHSLNCYYVARADGHEDDATLASVLLHDAAEAFVGDIVKPLKIMLPEFETIESQIESAIAIRFGLDQVDRLYQCEDVIREIDHAVLIAERRKLFSEDDVVWVGENEVRRVPLSLPVSLSMREVEKWFMDVCQQLGLCEGMAA